MIRINRSSKVNESACSIKNFATPMGLSFYYARAMGVRGSEKEFFEWWGSYVPYKMQLNDHGRHFSANDLPHPKPYWMAQELNVKNACLKILMC